jgi:quinol-cytochrome oxidoreductase complex cytochrome b subunit
MKNIVIAFGFMFLFYFILAFTNNVDGSETSLTPHATQTTMSPHWNEMTMLLGSNKGYYKI